MIRDVAGANSFCAERQNVAPGVEDEPARSRYIPSDAIERVHGRGKHQCEYKTALGRREVPEHQVTAASSSIAARYQRFTKGNRCSRLYAHSRYFRKVVSGQIFSWEFRLSTRKYPSHTAARTKKK